MKAGRTLFSSSAARAGLAIAGALLVSASSSRDDVAAPPQMRRLTQAQYRQTIAEIFGPQIKIVGRFEPDIRVDGLIAVGTSSVGVSPAGLEHYDEMARSIAGQTLAPDNIAKIMPCAPDEKRGFDRACARQFLSDVGERLYRRPLTHAEVDQAVSSTERSSRLLGGFYPGLRATLAGMLVSPNFLFRVDAAVPDGHGGLQLTAYSKAVRLSYFLVNTAPDLELLAAAQRGDLDTADGRARQVDRLLASPGYERGVRAFFWDMLQFEKFDTLSKDGSIYPVFSPRLAADAEEQTLRTLVDLLVTQNGDYRTLFTTRETWMNRQLGLVYAVPVHAQSGWEKYIFPASADRGGWLTDFSFLALHSHPGRSSPTLRGKAIREIFLCQPIPPPPPNVDFTVVQDTKNPTLKTARDRLEAHRTQPACAGCHKLMDPLGLALEGYDGAAMSRTTENGAPLNLSGAFDGKPYVSAATMGEVLSASTKINTCLVSNVYRYALGRNVTVAEKPLLQNLVSQFGADGYRLPALMRRIALSDAFYHVTVAAPVEPRHTTASLTIPSLRGRS